MIQEGFLAKQLMQMHQHKASLIVPQMFHSRYPQMNGGCIMDMEIFTLHARA